MSPMQDFDQKDVHLDPSLDVESAYKILRLLTGKTDITQRDISNHLGISLGKTNYLLRELAKKGLIKIKNFSRGKGKLRKVHYILTKKGFNEKLRLTYYFLQKKEREYLELKKEVGELKRLLGHESEPVLS